MIRTVAQTLRLAAATGLFAMAAAASAAGPAHAPNFAPHRAVFDIALSRTGAASGVSELEGRLVYELKGSPCEGYSQSTRFVTRSSNQEGEQQISDLRSTSWEDAFAKRLRFSSHNYQNAKLSEETEGDAKRPDAGSPATVAIVKPGKSESGLPANVYFPVQHSVAVLEAARSGALMLSADLYDGAENGLTIYATNTVIGVEAKPGTLQFPELAESGKRLAESPAWPISISYFEKKAMRGDAVPYYETIYRFHENGVISSLTIDRGDFAFSGRLKELTFLPQHACPADGAH